MDAEYIGSHAPYTPGASIDIPVLKSQYLKVQGNISAPSSRKHGLNDVLKASGERPTPEGVKAIYVKTPTIETMGLDPMISSAAVIHELAYGRKTETANLAKAGNGYLWQGGCLPKQLDLIV